MDYEWAIAFTATEYHVRNPSAKRGCLKCKYTKRQAANNWTLMTDRVHCQVADRNPIYGLIALLMSNAQLEGVGSIVCSYDREQGQSNKERPQSGRIFVAKTLDLCVPASRQLINQWKKPSWFMWFLDFLFEEHRMMDYIGLKFDIRFFFFFSTSTTFFIASESPFQV